MARTGNDEEPSAGSPTRSTKYIEPASIVTLTVGALYFIGWSYTDGYLGRIGIHHDSLDLATSFYLKQGYWAISVCWLIFVAFYLGMREKPKTRVEAFGSNLVIMATVPFLIGIAMYVSSSVEFYILILISLLLLTAAAVLSLRKQSIIYKLRMLSLVTQIFILIFFFVVSVYLAISLGEIRGIKIIEGTSYDSLKISFSWKEAPPAELGGGDLMLVIYRDGKYYVVKKEQPAPRLPKVYVIYDEQINYAEISRINDRPLIHLR